MLRPSFVRLTVSNISAFIIFVELVSILPIGPLEATSNVHSVWLAPASTRQLPDPSGSSQRVLSQRTGLWSVAAPQQQAAQQPTTAILGAASSLQPAIVALDAASDSSGRAELSEPAAVGANDSSSEPQLSPRQRVENNNNNNVQFDEESGQKQQLVFARNSPPQAAHQEEPSNGDLAPSSEVFHQQNNNNNSSSGSINQPASQSSAAVGVEDFVQPDNEAPPSGQSETPAILQPTHSFELAAARNRSANKQQPASFVYYLADPDKWNQQPQHNPAASSSKPPSSHTFGSQRSSQAASGESLAERRWRPQQEAAAPFQARRKLHNSGTQYDLRESRRPTTALDSDVGFERNERTRRISRPDQNYPNPLLLPPTQPGHRVGIGPTQPFVVLPYASHDLSGGPLLVRHPQRLQTNRYNQPRRQQVASIMTGSPTSGPRSWLTAQTPAQRSFLQSYVPSLLAGQRPKLKPATIFSSWLPAAAGERANSASQLEESFYSSSNSAARSRQPRPWRAANNYYLYGEQPAAAGATLGEHSQQIGRFHPALLHQAPQSSLSAGGGGENFVQQSARAPTLAPALSYLQSNHRGATSQPNQAPQQLSAGFIPVVAVSVTKTSPLPMQAAQHSTRMTEVSADEPPAGAADYNHEQPAKRRRDRNNQQVHFDDYGNYAAASGRYRQRHAHLPAGPRPAVETTTVKSALFGYLPHEAERPLLGAMNLFAPLQQQLAADSNRDTSLLNHHQQQQQQQQQQSDQQDHLNGLFNQLEEPPTPLGLQLQANSYVRNDIAHPFGAQLAADSSATADHRILSWPPLGDPTAGRQLNYNTRHEVPIVQSHQNLMNALLADGSLRNAHLLAAASELNPHLIPVVFAPPASLQSSQAIGSGQGQAADESSLAATDDSSAASEQHQQRFSPTRASSALNNKGNKKRSSDFFASAGQLLLSALPLLLAPTLGLMLSSAASPAAPSAFARYPSSAAAASQNPFLDPSSLQAIPSSYMSGLNQGIVSNASPAPLLFTPSPPLRHDSDTDSSESQAAKAAASPSQTTTRSPTTTTTTTSAASAGRGRPTLAPIQRLASWTGSTPLPKSRNYSIIVTTLGPARASGDLLLVANKSRVASNAEADSKTGPQDKAAVSGFERPSAAETSVLILASEEPDHRQQLMVSANSSAEKIKTHYDLMGGYTTGVDFDAQFASLGEKSSIAGQKKPATEQTDSEQDRNRLDRNRYQFGQSSYDQPADGISDGSLQRQQHKSSQRDNEEDNLKLFPVQTRRRTVSLVTSNGNRTMPDSSDKYSLDYSAAHLNGSLYSMPAQQASFRRRSRRDTSASMISNEILGAQTTNLTNVKDHGKRLVKIVKKRRLNKRPASLEGDLQNNGNKTAPPIVLGLEPMLGESSQARARFSNGETDSKPGNSMMSKSESTARIIATMVAQMSEPDETQENETDRELREHLLRRKIMLDKLATSQMYSSPFDESLARNERISGRRRHLAEDGEDLAVERNLSSGARGRSRPAPGPVIEAISSKIFRRPTEKDAAAAALGSRKHQMAPADEDVEANLVLADDTRKALTKFGNLLIKDTLQIPYADEHKDASKVNRSGSRFANKKRRKPLASNSSVRGQLEQEEEEEDQVDPEQEDSGESSATERSYSRTTPYPPPLYDNSRHHHHHNPPNVTTGYDSTYSRLPDLNYSSPRSQHYQRLTHGVQDQVNLIPADHNAAAADNIGSGYGPPYYGSRFGGRDERRSEPMNLVASRYAQPDRYNRSPPPESSYSNYSGSREHSHAPAAYGNYYSRPPAREPLQVPSGSRSQYDTRGHHHNYPPPLANYSPQNATNYPAPPPNHRPSDDYYDSRRDSYSSLSYPATNNDDHYHNRYPPDPRYPAASQEHESWPPLGRGNQDPRDYPPTGGSYSRPASSYPPPIDREPAYSSSPPQQQQQQQQQLVGLQMNRSIAGDSSAVNEYLKRVQFSDSDRDKLMASYLTCDGLLNDNDHCLERLSCEFSDPQNIERANKLDRAVSSILLGHILINTYIPNQFKLRLKSASLFGYTHSGNCSKYVCNKLAKSPSSAPAAVYS